MMNRPNNLRPPMRPPFHAARGNYRGIPPFGRGGRGPMPQQGLPPHPGNNGGVAGGPPLPSQHPPHGGGAGGRFMNAPRGRRPPHLPPMGRHPHPAPVMGGGGGGNFRGGPPMPMRGGGGMMRPPNLSSANRMPPGGRGGLPQHHPPPPPPPPPPSAMGGGRHMMNGVRFPGRGGVGGGRMGHTAPPPPPPLPQQQHLHLPPPPPPNLAQQHLGGTPPGGMFPPRHSMDNTNNRQPFFGPPGGGARPHRPPNNVAPRDPRQQIAQQNHQPQPMRHNNNNNLGVPNASLAPTKAAQSPDQAWTEYTAPNGMKYYHNSITGESTYNKPDVLKKAAVSASHTNKSATPVERPWAEYKDPTTGKTYYSNGTSTQWTKPIEMLENQSGSNATATDSANAAASPSQADTGEPPRKKKKTAASKETEFQNQEEAVAAFKGLLLAKDILPAQKWNEVVKICSPDARWDACEAVLSTGERKQALAEYQTKRANELRNQERQEKQRAKEAFLQLLSDVVPSTVSGFSAWNTRFEDLRDTLAKDGRFHAVADESTRESLFLDFCEEYQKREERRKRNEKRDAHENFIAFLREKEEKGILTYASTWSSFVASLDSSDWKDSRFEVSGFMNDNDRQLHFADFVLELQTAEDDKRRRIRDARRRAEKAQREAYREVLGRLAQEGILRPTSRFRDLEGALAEDPSFQPLQEQDRESPREIFKDYVDAWNEQYRHDRFFLGDLVSETYKRIGALNKDSSYDDFTRALLDEVASIPQTYARLRAIVNNKSPVSSARLYFEELQNRASRNNVRRSDDSSEDEGEIIEDGEIDEANESAPVGETKAKADDTDTAVSETPQNASDTIADEALKNIEETIAGETTGKTVENSTNTITTKMMHSDGETSDKAIDTAGADSPHQAVDRLATEAETSQKPGDATEADTSEKSGDTTAADLLEKSGDTTAADTSEKPGDATAVDTSEKTAEATAVDTSEKTAEATAVDTSEKPRDAMEADTSEKPRDAMAADTSEKTGDAMEADTSEKTGDTTVADAAGKPGDTTAVDADTSAGEIEQSCAGAQSETIVGAQERLQQAETGDTETHGSTNDGAVHNGEGGM